MVAPWGLRRPIPWPPDLRAVLRLGSEVAAVLSPSQPCPLALPPPRTEPAAGKETGAAKVSKNLELARLIPVSSSAQELGLVGLQGGPGGLGDPAPGTGRGAGEGSAPMRTISLFPPHCTLGLHLSLSLWELQGCPQPAPPPHVVPPRPKSPRLLAEVGCGSSGTPTPSPTSSPPSPAQADASGEAETEDAEGAEQAVYVLPRPSRVSQLFPLAVGARRPSTTSGGLALPWRVCAGAEVLWGRIGFTSVPLPPC